MLNCLIVEDEPLAAEILEDYIEDVPFLKLRGTYSDAIEAMEVLAKEQIEVLFLDIHLPKIKGLAFLRTLKNPPQVILTTAYHQYALEGYELEVVDYLLKPIEFARFLKAVQKLKKEGVPPIDSSRERPFRFFNENKRMVKVYLDEILYVESMKEYVKIIAKDQEVLTKFQIGSLEEELADANLIRVHRSFLVALDKIDAYSAVEIDIRGNRLPIGRSYRSEVHQLLKQISEGL